VSVKQQPIVDGDNYPHGNHQGDGSQLGKEADDDQHGTRHLGKNCQPHRKFTAKSQKVMEITLFLAKVDHLAHPQVGIISKPKPPRNTNVAKSTAH